MHIRPKQAEEAGEAGADPVEAPVVATEGLAAGMDGAVAREGVAKECRM